MNIDGTEPMRLTDHPALETSPCWSGDGTQIAFTRVREGVSSRVYIVPANGGTPHEVVAANGWAADPAWNPVTDELAFVLSKGNRNWGDIWFADSLKGIILRRWRYQGRESGLSWSDDGKMACCSHSARPSGEHANLMAFIVDSSEVHKITNSQAADREPDWWSPAE